MIKRYSVGLHIYFRNIVDKQQFNVPKQHVSEVDYILQLKYPPHMYYGESLFYHNNLFLLFEFNIPTFYQERKKHLAISSALNTRDSLSHHFNRTKYNTTKLYYLYGHYVQQLLATRSLSILSRYNIPKKLNIANVPTFVHDENMYKAFYVSIVRLFSDLCYYM